LRRVGREATDTCPWDLDVGVDAQADDEPTETRVRDDLGLGDAAFILDAARSDIDPPLRVVGGP